jgi:GT2 family glycosyltransferase
MFIRRRVIDEGFRFDERFKDVGDADFVIRVLRSGYRAIHVKRYLSVFTITGKNRSASQEAYLERKRLMASAPLWVKILKWPLNWARYIEKLIYGCCWERMPICYAIYISEDSTERKFFCVNKASLRWRTD